MTRGEIWTIAGGPDYAGKPRPALIVQDDSFAATASITVCPFTTDPTIAPLMRVAVAPSDANGLRQPCSLMVDKITTVSRQRLGQRIGAVDAETLLQFNRAAMVFLGLVGRTTGR